MLHSFLEIWVPVKGTTDPICCIPPNAHLTKRCVPTTYRRGLARSYPVRFRKRKPRSMNRSGASICSTINPPPAHHIFDVLQMEWC